MYARGILGSLFNATKSVVEGAAESGIGGELLDGAEALAPSLIDLACRKGKEYPSRFTRRDTTLSTTLPKPPGIEDEVETKFHALLNSITEHLESKPATQRDIYKRGVLGGILNSTESAIKTAVGSGIAGDFVDGVKALVPDLIGLAARDQDTSLPARHRASSNSLHEGLSEIEGSSKEKLHGLINVLEKHLATSSSQPHDSQARSIADGVQAADNALEPFGVSISGIVGSAVTSAASKAGSDAVTGAESLFHHFFNRTAIMDSIVTQGEQPIAYPSDPFSQFRRSI
jgi:hypothetical protein